MRRSPVHAAEAAVVSPRQEVQSLWFEVLGSGAKSVVLIPTDKDASARALAQELAQVATVERGKAVPFLNAENIDLAHGTQAASEISAWTAGGVFTVTCVDPVVQNVAALTVVRAAEAALLVIRVGDGDLDRARRTIELVGRDKVLGALAIHAPKRER
jgi:hypothetical protein